jgi:hypothetical protein
MKLLRGRDLLTLQSAIPPRFSPQLLKLEELEKNTLQFSHKQGEWKIKTIKGHKETADPSLTETFRENHHRISFPDFGTFVSQQAGSLFNLGTASCFPQKTEPFSLRARPPYQEDSPIFTQKGYLRFCTSGKETFGWLGSIMFPLSCKA